MKYKQSRGFTLIELMTVLVIVGILVAIAVPSFALFISKNNVESLQSNLGVAISTARSEAASRNEFMTICSSTDGKVCNGDDWNDGWIVFEDVNSDGVAATDGTELVVDVYDHSGSNYTLTAHQVDTTLGAGKSSYDDAVYSITYNSRGFLRRRTNNDTNVETVFTVCAPGDTDGVFARGLYANLSGLVMKTQAATVGSDNEDSVHNIPGGENLECL